MISANYVDGLELRIKELTAERDAALAREAELQTRNLEQLNNCLTALQIANKRIENLEKYNLDLANESHNKSNMIAYERSKNADAGRAGFIAGVSACSDYIDSYYVGMVTDADADQYAERVKAGEV